MGEWLSSLVTPERLPALLDIAKPLFFALMALSAVLMLFARHREAPSPKLLVYRLCFAVVALSLIAIFVQQAEWQLGGFSNRKFVEFQRRYNRRPDSPVKHMVRGRVTDRNGIVLAVDDGADTTRRVYPAGAACAHAIGYVHSFYGKNGVEAAEDAFLTGYTTGDDEEQKRFGLNLVDHREIRGNDLALTLDARLQRAAAGLMKGRRGAAIVLDPVSGDLLALCSAPAYDPNRLTPELFQIRGEASPLLNRALHGLYPPGSTFKMLVSALAIERGLAPVLDCPAAGYKPPAKWAKPIRDHEYYAALRAGRAWPGHGHIGMDRALAKSSNVYFAQLGVKLGPLTLNQAADAWQLRRPLPVCAGVSGGMAGKAGVFPALESDDFGASAQIAIGQGSLLVTPLHMALVGAAIANDGRMPAPRLTARTPHGTLTEVMSAAHAARLRTLLRGVVTGGTGRAADIPGLDVAGKTGTAQAPGGDDHAWFVCMAPQARPRIVVAVLVEHGGFGAEAALPVAVGLLKEAQADGWLGPVAAGVRR